MKIKMIILIMAGLLTTHIVQAQDTSSEVQTVEVTPDATSITDIDIAPIQAEVTSVQPITVNPETPNAATPVEPTKT